MKNLVKGIVTFFTFLFEAYSSFFKKKYPIRQYWAKKATFQRIVCKDGSIKYIKHTKGSMTKMDRKKEKLRRWLRKNYRVEFFKDLKKSREEVSIIRDAGLRFANLK